MLAQLIGEATESDGRVEVDGEAHVGRGVPRENAAAMLSVRREAVAERAQPNLLGDLLEEDLDEDSAG